MVQELGINPNLLGSVHSSLTGLSSLSILNPSVSLNNVEVRDMGLRSLLKSSIEVPLGTGGIFACFQIRGGDFRFPK